MLRRNLQKKKEEKEMVQFHFYKDANHFKAEKKIVRINH